jgi:hypothetical protein
MDDSPQPIKVDSPKIGSDSSNDFSTDKLLADLSGFAKNLQQAQEKAKPTGCERAGNFMANLDHEVKGFAGPKVFGNLLGNENPVNDENFQIQDAMVRVSNGDIDQKSNSDYSSQGPDPLVAKNYLAKFQKEARLSGRRSEVVNRVRIVKKAPKREETITTAATGTGDRQTVSNLTEMMTKEGKIAVTRAHIGQSSFVKNFFLTKAQKYDTVALDIMRDMYKEARKIARANKMEEFATKRPQTTKARTTPGLPKGPSSNFLNDGNLTTEKSLTVISQRNQTTKGRAKSRMSKKSLSGLEVINVGTGNLRPASTGPRVRKVYSGNLNSHKKVNQGTNFHRAQSGLEKAWGEYQVPIKAKVEPKRDQSPLSQVHSESVHSTLRDSLEKRLVGFGKGVSARGEPLNLDRLRLFDEKRESLNTKKYSQQRGGMILVTPNGCANYKEKYMKPVVEAQSDLSHDYYSKFQYQTTNPDLQERSGDPLTSRTQKNITPRHCREQKSIPRQDSDLPDQILTFKLNKSTP